MGRPIYPVELHKKAFLLWASGISLDRLAKLPGFPDKRTLLDWKKGTRVACNCGFHRWNELRAKMTQEEIAAELQKENLDLQSLFTSMTDQEVESELFKFITKHEKELRPLFRRIRNVFGISTNGKLTGNLHVDMLITGYLLVLKVRESIVKIEINDAYQLIQLMRTLVQLFKEWKLPSEPIKVEEEVVEIKLVEADRPTPWKENLVEATADVSEEWGSTDD